MDAPQPDRLTTVARWLALVVIALVPFHAFLTVWVSSFIGHYTLLRLWDDGLLLIISVLTAVIIWRRPGIRAELTSSVLMRLIGIYVLLNIILGVIAFAKHEVTSTSLGYGLLVDLRFMLFFVVLLALARTGAFYGVRLNLLVLIPAIVVAVFGVLQYVALPLNFLSHFGYGPATIAPYETINNDPNYIRVMSTLRGANPLGTYLVLIISCLVAVLTRSKRKKMVISLFTLTLFALLFSFSRSAWLGTLLAATIAVWIQLPKGKPRKLAVGIAAGLIIVSVGGLLLLGKSNSIQNALYHTSDDSKVAVSSNDAHASASQDGLGDAVHQPFGGGPGTAGPASTYNRDHGVRIAENYYVQIAQETGWAGLVLFLTIILLVARRLYVLRRQNPLALGLFAGLIGVSLVGLLSHVWTDDSVAFIWWGLAGIVIGRASASDIN